MKLWADQSDHVTLAYPVPTPRPHNLFGQHGPRCVWCSGYGQTFALGGSAGTIHRTTTRCTCGGTGIDHDRVRDQQMSDLQRRLDALDRVTAQQARRIASLTKQLKGSRVQNSRQFWNECIAWATADGTAIANTTTEAVIFPNITIPANYLQDGRALRLRAFGKLSTTGTPTMIWAFRWGGVAGTVLATSEAITQGSGVTNVNWGLEALVQTRANGSSGSLLVMGELGVHTSSTAVASNVFGVSGFDAPAAVTVDLTADTALSLTADWSAQSASNTLTGMMYYVESLN